MNVSRAFPAAGGFLLPSRLLLLCACLTAASLVGCSLPFGLGSKPQKPQEKAGPTCVVLALPSTGAYTSTAAKIDRGAHLAQAELARNNTPVRLEIINSEAPDWLQKLDALPEQCVVVGGVLERRTYTQARNTHNLDKRAFFAFVPSLEQGDEGHRAWRFFFSPQDQVDALINFTTDGLNIRAYGAFYPAEEYGTRMTALLEQSLAARNMVLQKANYVPGAQNTWTAAVAPLINPVKQEGSQRLVPQTSFEALFLPDKWKNMSALTSSLLHNGEDRLVLLGTSDWQQALSGKTVAQADRYTLAVFPGAWNPLQVPKALSARGTDFWTALGYDFVRFAANLGLRQRSADPKQITAAAQRAASLAWSMAPLSWDAAGVAHQKLFVFRVTPTGMRVAHTADFQQLRTQVLQQSTLRMQRGEPIAPATPQVSDTAPADVTPVNAPSLEETPSPQPQPAAAPQAAPAAAPVLSTTPRPSYKLSLPVTR